MPIVQIITLHVDVTYSTLSCGSNSFRVRDTPSPCSVRTVLHGPSSALLNDDIVEGLDCSSLTLGEACVVTWSTASGDTEIQRTCIFDRELTSILLEGSTPSCQRVSGDLSILMPPFTANNDCPMTVFGKSWIDCSSGPVAMSGTAAFTGLIGSADGA